MLTEEQKAFAKNWKWLYSRFYQRAAEKFETLYKRYLGDVKDVRSHLDESYCERLLSIMEAHDLVVLEADKAWPGTGWSLRERNSNGQCWRRVGGDGSASVVVRLCAQTSFVFSMVFQSIPIEALDAIRVTCGTREMIRSNYVFEGSYLEQHWLLTKDMLDSSGAGVVNIAIDPAFADLALVAAIRVSPVPLHSGQHQKVLPLWHLIARLASRMRVYGVD